MDLVNLPDGQIAAPDEGSGLAPPFDIDLGTTTGRTDVNLINLPTGQVASPDLRGNVLTPPFNQVLVYNDFRKALRKHLIETPEIAALFGIRIFHKKIPQAGKLPAIVYQIIADSPGRNLSGSDGTSTARVQLSLYSLNDSDVIRGAEVLRQRQDGYTGLLGSLIDVTGAVLVAAMDAYEEPDNGSDDGTFGVVLDFRYHYRVSKPTLS